MGLNKNEIDDIKQISERWSRCSTNNERPLRFSTDEESYERSLRCSTDEESYEGIGFADDNFDNIKESSKRLLRCSTNKMSNDIKPKPCVDLEPESPQKAGLSLCCLVRNTKHKQIKTRRQIDDAIYDDLQTLSSFTMRQRRSSNPDYLRSIQRLQRNLAHKNKSHKPFS